MFRTVPLASTRRKRVLTALITSAMVALGLAQAGPALAAKKAIPSGFVVKSTDTTSISLDWMKVSGASGYRVRYSTSSNMAGSKALAFRYSNGVVSGLKPTTKYWFRIAAAANYGSGAAQSQWTPAPYLSGTTKRASDGGGTGGGGGGGTGNGNPYDLNVAAFNISGVLNDTSKNAPWADRKVKIAQQLLGQNPDNQTGPQPDAIALQEANTTEDLGSGLNQYTQLVATLNSHATGTAHYSAIDGITSLATRIAYNDTTLSLISAGAVKWDAQETKADGLRYMPWAIFKVNSTGSQFFFASDHLETASESVRRSQWTQLLSVVPRLANGLPVVFGGDFNSPRGAESRCGNLPNPTANVMLPKMVPSGFGDTLGQIRCSTRPTVSGARAEHVVNGNSNSVNKFNRSVGYYSNSDIVGQDVDYIFASNALRVKSWEMVYDAASGSHTLRGVIPSDHNMIRAKIVLPGH